MSTLYTLFSRNQLNVVLIASEDTSKIVEDLSSPYFIARHVNNLPYNVWTINLVPWFMEEKETEFKKITFTPDGEPLCTMFLNGDKKIIYLIETQSQHWDAQHALRLIRKLLRLQKWENNHFFAHGGLLKIGDIGIAFLGEKKAGKTSTILSMLSQISPPKPISFITNDDASFNKKDGLWEGLGWPRAISVREDSFQVIKINRKRFSEIGLSHPTNFFNVSEVREFTFFYPKELSRLFRKDLLEKSALDIIIFPKFLPRDQYGAQLNKLSTGEAFESLKKNIEMNPGKYNEYLLPYFRIPLKESLEEMARQIASDIPCFELQQSFHSLGIGSKLVLDLINGMNEN